MDTMLFIGKFVFLRNSAPIGKKEHKKLGELRENSSKGITLKDHRRYNINNQAEQSNTKFKVSSTFSTAGGSAVFREAFRVSKRLQRHNTKVLLDFFLKNRAGQGAQSPLKARTHPQTLSVPQIKSRLDMLIFCNMLQYRRTADAVP